MIKKRRQHIEDDEQKIFFQLLFYKYPEIYEMAFHIPNGGRRSIIEASRLKSQGVKPGVPDILIAIPSKCYHGLFIEFKRPIIAGSPIPSVTKEQKEWIKKLNAMNYRAVICYGATEALDTVKEYLDLPAYRK